MTVVRIVCKSVWSTRRLSQVDRGRLRPGHFVCLVRVVGARAHSLRDRLVALLTDREPSYILTELVTSIVVLAWSDTCLILRPVEETWPLRRGVKVDGGRLGPRLTVSSIGVVGTWAHRLRHALLSLLRDLEARSTLAELSAVIVLARGDVNILGLSEGRWATWSGSHVDVGDLGLSLTVSSVGIIRSRTHCFRNALLAFLRYGEGLGIFAKALPIIVLARCHVDIPTLGEGVRPARSGPHIDIWNLRFDLPIRSVWIVGAWAHRLRNTMFTFFWNCERFYVFTKLSTIVILTRRYIYVSALGERCWSTWGGSHVDVWDFRLGQTICSVRVVCSRTHCLHNSLLSLLRDFKAFDIGIEPDSIIILAWSDVYISTFGKGLWSTGRRAQVYVRHLWFCLPISSIGIVSTRAHSLYSSGLSLFTDFEALYSGVERNAVVILTWSNINVTTFGK